MRPQKPTGDISDLDKELIEELVEAEIYWDSKSQTSLALGVVPKAYVCLAHDWLELGMEENATILLEKAEAVYPGYSKGLMIEQAKDDPDFAWLVSNLDKQFKALIISLVKK